MSRDGKKKAYRFGRWAETLCVWRLRLGGYKIIERDYRQSTGEIDIIAKRGRLLAFIEVKAQQRRRIERTALVFSGQRPELTPCDNRFALMIVTPMGWPRHIPGAWRLGE